MYAYTVKEVMEVMPNKTIYIKDSDAEVWDKAQKKLGGESISSIITDCLKERLRVGKALDNVEAMKDLLGETNAELTLNLELHPFWPPVILDANTLDVGYKLHQKRAKPEHRLVSRQGSTLALPTTCSLSPSWASAAR